MAFAHGVSTKVLVDDKDLSTYFNSAEVAGTGDVAETTTFGVTGSARTFIRGLNTGTVRLAGLYDGAAGAVDAELHANLTATGGQPVTVGAEGLANGKRVKCLVTRETSYSVSSPVDGAVAISAELQADGPLDEGISLKDLGTSIAAQASVDHGQATFNGGAAYLHVTANSRNGSTTYIVQDSADNVSWTTLITFAAVGASTTTSERIAVTGTVNRYMRAGAATQGGSTGTTTAQISFARR